MNKTTSRSSLVESKFILEMHFSLHLYFAYELFNKHKQRTQISNETGGSTYIHKYSVDKASFQHGMAYNASKKLAIRTISDKGICNKATELIKIQIVMNIREEFFQWL